MLDFLTAHLGAATPWVLVVLFLAASLLMVWRLEHLTQSGMEGTVLGTLVMPYCSGIGNLIFVWEVARQRLPGSEVMVNSLVNNITNMTLCIGLPAIIWGVRVLPSSKRKAKRRRREEETRRLNRLSMLLTLLAVLFFTGATWALARGDGRLDFGDGLVLVGLFLFWQCFQVFDVLKSNVRENRSLPWTLALDFALLLVGGYGVYLSVQGLVDWLAQIDKGFISVQNLGWLSGWLMVLPNAGLALFYGWKRKPEVIYTSQVGDGHICIPLCVGLAAISRPMQMPDWFDTAALILTAAVVIHTLVVLIFGQLPRFMGWLLAAVYAFFLYNGLLT